MSFYDYVGYRLSALVTKVIESSSKANLLIMRCFNYKVMLVHSLLNVDVLIQRQCHVPQWQVLEIVVPIAV